MTESVPELIARRMGELQITSLLALHRRLTDPDSITYETVRNLANGKQRGTRDDRVIRDLAIMLAVDEATVREAVGADPTYGPWELPPRAQGLDPQEREVVISVVDALLRAKRAGGNDGRQPEAEKRMYAAMDAAVGLLETQKDVASGKLPAAEIDWMIDEMRQTYGVEAVDVALAWVRDRRQKADQMGDPFGDLPLTSRRGTSLAARRTKSRGKQLRAEMDAAGEESQE